MNSMMGSRGPAGSSMGNNRAGSYRDKIPEGYETGQLKQFTPEQMRLFKSMFSQVSPDSYLSKLGMGDESTFEQMEAPAMRQFQALQGQLGSRFSGMGMGAQRGSGFQNAANQQTSDFAMDLASRRQQLQRQAIQDLMGISNDLLGQKPYDRYLVKPQPEQNGLLGLLGTAGGAGIGGYFGGPQGAMAGAQIGHSIGSSF